MPPPLPFYADLLAVFLVGSGVGFIPAVLNPAQQRPYLWTFGVGVKLVAALLFLRLALTGLVGWLPGIAAAADGALAVLLADGVAQAGEVTSMACRAMDEPCGSNHVTPSSTRSNLK